MILQALDVLPHPDHLLGWRHCTPQTEDVRMIERFTLHREEGRLDYEVTVTDPKNLVAPAVWEATRVWIPGVEVRPFQCTLK